MADKNFLRLLRKKYGLGEYAKHKKKLVKAIFKAHKKHNLKRAYDKIQEVEKILKKELSYK